MYTSHQERIVILTSALLLHLRREFSKNAENTLVNHNSALLVRFHIIDQDCENTLTSYSLLIKLPPNMHVFACSSKTALVEP